MTSSLSWLGTGTSIKSGGVKLFNLHSIFQLSYIRTLYACLNAVSRASTVYADIKGIQIDKKKSILEITLN